MLVLVTWILHVGMDLAIRYWVTATDVLLILHKENSQNKEKLSENTSTANILP